MRLHIIGVCGTFMGGLAILARSLGHEVSGSDANVYPPMSTQLQEQGIELLEGYSADNLKAEPDLVIIGNAVSRGNPEVEAVLNQGLPYTSGAQWLSENILQKRWVLAVAGTHGKTTTASMLAWILEDCGFKPGYLIGGVPQNFGESARLGDEPFFVIEADEYDTAFFDKRAKFVHYRPRTVILNNLEFDHADIYDSLADIETQFHHLVRMVPENGKLIVNAQAPALQRVLERGRWTPIEIFNIPGTNSGGVWNAIPKKEDSSSFEITFEGLVVGKLDWNLIGEHNMNNAVAAIAAARHVGITPASSIEALVKFKNTKRRMELIGKPGDISIYDDFAHHPTAIKTTLDGLRASVGEARIFAVLELRSNTMKMGVHKKTLADSITAADQVIVLEPDNLDWNIEDVFDPGLEKITIVHNNDQILNKLKMELRPGDHVLIMSNGSFGGLHQQVLESLQSLERKQ